MKQVRWGVLGTARIAKSRVIPAIRQSSNGVLHGIASRRIERAQTLVNQDGEGKAYEGYEALLADPKIDAVYIPLPNHLHKEWTLKAMAAGKDVLVEKPFALNSEEANTMATAAARHERLLMEAFMYRFHPRSLQIQQMVQEGTLGKIGLIHAAFSSVVRPDQQNRRLFSVEMGGGSLLDVGCYGVSVTRWLLGKEPVAVTAQAVYDANDVDINFVCTLSFEGGTLATISGGFVSTLQQTFSVMGDKAGVELPHDGFIPWDKPAHYTVRQPDAETGTSYTVPGTDEYQRMVEDFGDAVLGVRALPYPPEESVAQMRVLDALSISAKTGRKIMI